MNTIKKQFLQNLIITDPKFTNNFEEKIIQIARVSKSVKGGKILTFRALIVLGNKNHIVGFGLGRADNVNLAIEKAIINAKKTLMVIPFTEVASIPHIIKTKYGASTLMIHPAKAGTGIIASGIIRTMLEFAGIKNILTKQFGSNNSINNAKALIKAFKLLV
jgi:small subunit ribosomal protein S5